ncbi:protein SMG9 [Drosophila ficusphila]|uniref:protein SMG9 n=1 Tax=Drosophila ficusphila TaxID=30025 RepID=UPI0007E893DF|nr:protein SMG9 [Drosophila ficusphila]
MAEPRRRFRNKKRDDPSSGPLAPVTIARREDARMVQPKILLKKDRDRDKEWEGERERERDRYLEREKEVDPSPNSRNSNPETPVAIKTIIINRTTDLRPADKCQISVCRDTSAQGSGHLPAVASSSVCAALVSSVPNGRGKGHCGGGAGTAGSASGAPIVLQEQLQPPRMNRPTPLIVANGIFNANARKLFHKTNTDFTVIGVLGGQYSGKSTLLNLLAAERSLDYDYYQHLFSAEADECIFATRHKVKPNNGQKSILRPRTETLQFFITQERHILLDTPPLLPVGKEPDQQDLYSLAAMAQLLSVCHVLILVVDGLAVEQLRLINAALRLRPTVPCKGYVRDHLPQVLFVRARASRMDFDPQHRERLDKKLAYLYGPTGLPIYRGRGEGRCLNTFLLPEVSGNGATAFHPGLGELVRQFRERVLGSTRVSMCHTSTELSEAIWFEILAESARRGAPHFEKIYAEIKMRHLDTRCQWRSDNWRSFPTGPES